MPRYSSTNRITRPMLVSTGRELCRGAYGTQSDAQCLGYDRVCALAALFYEEARQKVKSLPSYTAVGMAEDEIKSSPYSRGFQHGWDMARPSEDDPEYVLGHRDGSELTAQILWRGGRSCDVAAR